MEKIPKSGFYYANKFTLITIKAYEDVMGKNGLNAIFNLAGLSNLIDNYPPDNLERLFDFADYTALHIALEEMYGPRGGRGLALRAGRATFNDALKNHDLYTFCFHYFSRGVSGTVDKQGSAVVKGVGQCFPTLLASSCWWC